jgi:hypothetical protein
MSKPIDLWKAVDSCGDPATKLAAHAGAALFKEWFHMMNYCAGIEDSPSGSANSPADQFAKAMVEDIYNVKV